MTIDEYTLIADLFGKRRSETRPAESHTSTIVGVATSDSVDGSVRVRLNGDVTGGEDGEVVIPTEAHILKGDVVSISLVGGTAKAPRVTGTVGGGDRIYARLVETELLVADKADIEDLTAATARIGDLETNALTASSAVITDLQADTAKVHDLTANELSAATGYVGDLVAGNLTAANLLLETAKVENVTANEIEAAVGYIDDLTTGNVTAANIVADHSTVGSLSSNYAQVNMANVNNAWIENGVVKDGAITNAMINSVSANKLTAGTIDASNITVTNLNASNITTGTINGQRIGTGSLSLDKLADDVYTEAEVDSMLSTMQAEIDGAIETWTGTAVPTLNNSPASGWTTNAVKDTHVGDVYFVVNSQSQQNGYNYRFTKSGSTYSWQLIKDSDVTNALSRIEAAEGQITQFDSDISTLQTDTGSLATRTTSLEGRMTTAEGDIDLKVDTTTFNSLSSTVDGNTTSITSLSTIAENNGLTSSTNITSTVNTVSQTASGNSSKISQLITTVGANADGTNPSTDSVISRTSAVEQDLSGFKTTVSSTYATQSALSTTNGNVTAAQTDATNALNRQTAYSATSSTGATTAAKVASCTNFPTLAAGATVTVRFSTANTSTGAITLNVNSTGAKTVYVNGAATSSSNQLLWAANANVTFTYDGTYWRVDSEPRSWYGTGSVAAATAAKTATINEIVVCKGTSVTLNMTYENTNTSATLNVTSTGAKNIYYGTTTTRPTTANGYGWGAGSTVTLVFDGAYWRIGDTTALARLTTAEGVISTHTTSLEQTASAISAKADASDVYTKSQTDGLISTEVTNRNAAIIAKANEITTSVSETYTTKTEFNNLEVGGRNLLRRTANPSIGDMSNGYWAKWLANDTVEKTSDGIKITSSGSSTSFRIPLVYEGAISIGETITISFDYRGNMAGTGAFYFMAKPSPNVSATMNSLVESTTEWVHFEQTFSFSGSPGGPAVQFMFPYKGASGKWFEIKDGSLKLERGNKATDWTPAPEDLEAYTDSQVTAAKAEIKVTTDGISSEVSKMSSAKYVNSSTASWTLPNIKTYAAEGHSENWNVTSTEGLRVGDTVYIKGTDSTRNCTVYIKTTVTSISSTTKFVGTSHGYEDVLPVETIKSTINQSADSVKIEARHVEIDGAAIFSNTAFRNAADAAYDAKGAAATAKSEAISAAATDATNKANAANSQEQLIYCSKASGTTSLSANTTWVTATGDTQNAWTLRRPTYSQSYPVLFVATQRKTVGGTVTCTTPQIDNTITVIDGGNIITGSVAANKVDFAEASGTQLKLYDPSAPTSYATVGSGGMDVVKGGTSVAQFGETARVGTAAGKNVKIDADSVDICDGDEVKATIDENGLAVNGRMSFRDVLYDNASGTNGTITLSQSAANYNHMRIHTKTNYGHGSVDVPNPNGKDVLLLSMATDNSAITTMYFIQQSRYISGTTLSVNHSGYAWMVSRSAASDNTGVNANSYMYVTRVEAWNE